MIIINNSGSSPSFTLSDHDINMQVLDRPCNGAHNYCTLFLPPLQFSRLGI